MTQTFPRWRIVTDRLILLCVILTASGCQRKAAPHPEPHPHYVVGTPWMGSAGVWFYPREQVMYHSTGLAVVEVTHPEALTADGEVYDPHLSAAAHQTLQLPSIIRVTNLETGRQLILRLNDRGPAEQGRVLAVTPEAAARLGMRPGVPTRVSIDLDLDRSQAIGDGPKIAIAAAPVEDVQQQSLGAAGSADGPASGSSLGEPPASLPAQHRKADRDPDEVVQHTSPSPGALWIDAGQFQQKSYADKVAADIDGTVRSQGRGRQASYQVRLGPFQSTVEADGALDRARQAGVTGARIIVE